MLPSGFRVHLEKQPYGAAWRLVGSRPRGTFCHKPCTVSGGGKSEISKSIAHALLNGPVYVSDYKEDMDKVAEIFQRDFSRVYKNRPPDARSSRSILSPDRTLGSVIRLFTTSAQYTDEHNEWIRKLPQSTRQLLFTVKRYYRPEWGDNWREHFTVDRINGYLGNELKLDSEPLISNYLRVGHDRDGAWRIYKLRPDFCPAEKVQVEDDITASVVLPRSSLNDLDREFIGESVKLVANCETLLFQRPDDAIHRGVDRQAEADIAGPGTFLSNYEPLTSEQARGAGRARGRVRSLHRSRCSACSRISCAGESASDGAGVRSRVVASAPGQWPAITESALPAKASRSGLAARGLSRRTSPRAWNAKSPPRARSIFPSTRSSPAAGTARPIPRPVCRRSPSTSPSTTRSCRNCSWNVISSLTGKSPATTGFGSEGALTKGPFNALWPVVDLNNALVSAILTGYAGFTTSAGYVGPHFRVDHDVSLLVPEIWCRMRAHERDPRFLIDSGFLEKIEDFAFEGRVVLASRLGYRITMAFVDHYPRPHLRNARFRLPHRDAPAGIAGCRDVRRGRATPSSSRNAASR